MTADLLALLDQLDEARAKATPGEWEKVGRYRIDAEGDVLARVDRPADAALIVAAVNALPKLTAALRAVLSRMDFADGTGRVVFGNSDGGAVWVRDIRAAITAALTPEQVQS